MLEELGVPYELREYKRNPKTMRAPPELRQLHPLGKSPVVSLGEVVLAESGAIQESLLDRYDPEGKLRPVAGAAERDAYHYWTHYAEGSAMPPNLVWLIFDNLRKAKVPFFVKPIVKTIAGKVDAAYTKPEMARHSEFVDGHLAKQEFFAGSSFTAADIQMFYPVDVRALRRGLAGAPGTQAWLERVKARPAYQKAVERGGANALPTMQH